MLREQFVRWMGAFLLCVGLLFGGMGCPAGGVCKCGPGQVCAGSTCVPVEGAQESTTPENPPSDGGLPPCPDRCQSDRDCVFCGERKTCDTDTNTCVDVRTQCPKVCNKDADCSKAGCEARTSCNLAIHECVELVEQCPDSCTTNDDCKAGGCGPRSECSLQFRTCVDPTVANCPVVCQNNDGCKECGTRNQCSFNSPTSTSGICREFKTNACPDFCQSTDDCFTQGCGEKKYCNFALGACVDKDNICPFQCNADTDCSKNCGTRTFCYKSSPDLPGNCTNPPTQTACPANCRSSFSCKAKDCAERAFCHQAKQECVSAEEACPGACKQNSDCPVEKCGNNVRCNNGRCVVTP